MFSYGFSSCTCLYEWLFILVWVFVMYMFVQMTIHIIVYRFSSCTFLYKWLSFLSNGLLSCTFLCEWLPFLFEWIFVMYISVRRTTISFWKDCCHLHFCTNDYTISYWMDCFHAHFCTNDYHFFFDGLSSCTFLCEWLPFLFVWIFVMHVLWKWLSILYTWIFVMHVSVRMTFHILLVFPCVQCPSTCE